MCIESSAPQVSNGQGDRLLSNISTGTPCAEVTHLEQRIHRNHDALLHSIRRDPNQLQTPDRPHAHTPTHTPPAKEPTQREAPPAGAAKRHTINQSNQGRDLDSTAGPPVVTANPSTPDGQNLRGPTPPGSAGFQPRGGQKSTEKTLNTCKAILMPHRCQRDRTQ